MTEDEINTDLDNNYTLALVPIDHELAKAARRHSRSRPAQSPYDRLWKIMRSAAKKVNALPERDRRALERMCTNTIVFGPDPDATIDAAIKKVLSKQ
jgi:hypothetical protein